MIMIYLGEVGHGQCDIDHPHTHASLRPVGEPMMDKDTRNLKKICALLHEARQQGHRTYDHVELEQMIATAEKIYHDRKEL